MGGILLQRLCLHGSVAAPQRVTFSPVKAYPFPIDSLPGSVPPSGKFRPHQRVFPSVLAFALSST